MSQQVLDIILAKNLEMKRKKDWQGWQSESASIAWIDWIWFLATTILTLPGQVWKIDDFSRLIKIQFKP